MKIEEQISQFLDGEMDSAQSANLMKQLRDQEARQIWSRYHLIGDAMRRELPDSLSHGLAARVSQALDKEPNLFAPNAMQASEAVDTIQPGEQVAAAGRSSWRSAWAFGLAASMAMVGVFSLQTTPQNELDVAPISVAQVSSSVPVELVRPHISTVAGIDRPVVKPAPPALLAEQNPVPNGHWKRLDLSRPEFSPYVQPSSEFSTVPGVAPSRPMAHVASFGENRAQ